MQRFCKAVCLLILCLPFLLSNSALSAMLMQPRNWPTGLLLLFVAWLLRSVPARALQLNTPVIALLVLYLAMLLAALFRQSAWLAVVAFGVAVLLISRSAGLAFGGRLFLLLALIIGLPRSVSAPLQAAIEERLIQHSSALASSLGFLHFREGTVTGSLTTAADLQQIFDSPAGTWGFTVLVAGLLLFRRRTPVQVLLALPAAVLTSLLGQFSCCLLAIMTLTSPGLQLPPGLWPWLLLLPLAVVALSLQGAVLFLTSAVILDEGKVFAKATHNPANRLWGRYVSGDLPEKWSTVSLKTADGNRLSVFACFLAFFKDWGISRKVTFLYRAIPGMALLVPGLLAEHAGASALLTINSSYESRLAAAREQGNKDTEELCLRALAGLQSADLQRRMRLAEFLWQHRNREAGWSEILRLADDGASGFAEANLWIVRNALSAEPYQPQSAEQLIDRLRRALRAAPDTAEAHGLLAQLYPAVGEKRLGEQHLVLAAAADPAWVDALAELLAAEGRLQPDDSRVQSRCDMLSAQLQITPADAELRVRLARLLLLTGRMTEAELLLDQGLQLGSNILLSRAAADLQIMYVRQELTAARQQGDRSMLAVRRAFSLDPQHPVAPLLASFLHLQGATFTGFAEAALQHWEHSVAALPSDDSPGPSEKSDATLRNMAHLAFALDRHADCLTTFRRMSQLRHEDIKVQAAAMLALGQTTEAEAAVQAVVMPLIVSNLAADRTAAADLLAFVGRFDDALACLELPDQSDTAKTLLAGARASVALEQFDRLTGFPGDYALDEAEWVPQVTDGTARQLTALLEQGLLVREFCMRAADRLYRMSLQTGVVGRTAETALDRLRAQGVAATDVLVALGSRALQAGRIEPAIRWLRMAQTGTDSPDAALLNNLALALARSDNREFLTEALRLSSQAVAAAPGSHYMLTTRAEIQLALGDIRAAYGDLEQARRIRPDFPETLQLLAKVSVEQGNLQQAELYLQEAAKLQAVQP